MGGELQTQAFKRSHISQFKLRNAWPFLAFTDFKYSGRSDCYVPELFEPLFLELFHFRALPYILKRAYFKV